MSVNTTEKITINMNAVDLGKVDLLVEEGHYTNRTDFIRTAIRTQLDRHESDVKESIVRKEMVVGVLVFTRKGLEKHLAKREKLQVKTIGIVAFEDDIPPQLADQTIESIKVLGSLRMSNALRTVLAKRIR